MYLKVLVQQNNLEPVAKTIGRENFKQIIC